MKSPEADVAIFAAIGPYKRKPQPETLDESFAHRAAHGIARAVGTLANSLGKCKMHVDRTPFVSLLTSMNKQ